MGRVMRAHEGKDFGVWLDHSGNYLRFREEWEQVYSEGVESLDDGGEKAKKEPTEKEKQDSKCPACDHLWPARSDICVNCGCVRERKPMIETVPGSLEELGGVAAKNDRQKFYSELLFIAMMKSYKPNWAAHKYRERFGVWPRGLDDGVSVPSAATINWVKSRQIAWAKAQRKI
jgi:hypothetical protein